MIQNRGKDVGCLTVGINCGINCFYRKHDSVETRDSQVLCSHRRWVLLLVILIAFEYYYNVLTSCELLRSGNRRIRYIHTSPDAPNVTRKQAIVYYRYPLNNSADISMDYKHAYNSSYHWFMSMKHLFTDLGVEEIHLYTNKTPICQLKEVSLGTIKVNKTEPTLEWVEQQNVDVKLGGYYAPAHCRSTQRVAVIVPYRDRKPNLAVFLRYLHPFLKKQKLEYRIFVIEQYGTEEFNRGTLYNIAFLETQRFGKWHCLIFHDVDLIPEDERISYSCPEHPAHMSCAVESFGYVLPYHTLFGGVTSFLPEHYVLVNGYSNFYWGWGAEDDDMYVRLWAAKLPMLRYNCSIARYSTLPHVRNIFGKNRHFFLDYSKLRYRLEGLVSTKYNLISVTKKKLFTHILADVNPIKMRLDFKSKLRQIVHLFDNSITYAGVEAVDQGYLHVDEKHTVIRLH